MAAYAEIEVALQQYLALAGYTGTARPMSARQLARAALSRQLISAEIADAIEGATVLRNLAAHGPGDEINREKAAEYLVLADAVLFAIEARREALENQQVVDTEGEAQMPKPYCNAVGCGERRIRPDSTHCKIHDPAWRAIQRDQKAGFTPSIKERRIALGMNPTPRR